MGQTGLKILGEKNEIVGLKCEGKMSLKENILKMIDLESRISTLNLLLSLAVLFIVYQNYRSESVTLINPLVLRILYVPTLLALVVAATNIDRHLLKLDLSRVCYNKFEKINIFLLILLMCSSFILVTKSQLQFVALFLSLLSLVINCKHLSNVAQAISRKIFIYVIIFLKKSKPSLFVFVLLGISLICLIIDGRNLRPETTNAVHLRAADIPTFGNFVAIKHKLTSSESAEIEKRIDLLWNVINSNRISEYKLPYSYFLDENSITLKIFPQNISPLCLFVRSEPAQNAGRGELDGEIYLKNYYRCLREISGTLPQSLFLSSDKKMGGINFDLVDPRFNTIVRKSIDAVREIAQSNSLTDDLTYKSYADEFGIQLSQGGWFHHYYYALLGTDDDIYLNQYGVIVNQLAAQLHSVLDIPPMDALIYLLISINLVGFLPVFILYKHRYSKNLFLLGYLTYLVVLTMSSSLLAPMLWLVRILPQFIFILLLLLKANTLGNTNEKDRIDWFLYAASVLIGIYNFENSILTSIGIALCLFTTFEIVLFRCLSLILLTSLTSYGVIKSLFYSRDLSVNLYQNYLSNTFANYNFSTLSLLLSLVIVGTILVMFIRGRKPKELHYSAAVFLLLLIKPIWNGSYNHFAPYVLVFSMILAAHVDTCSYAFFRRPQFIKIFCSAMIMACASMLPDLTHKLRLIYFNGYVDPQEDYTFDFRVSSLFKVHSSNVYLVDQYNELKADDQLIISSSDNVLQFYDGHVRSRGYSDFSTQIVTYEQANQVGQYIKNSNKINSVLIEQKLLDPKGEKFKESELYQAHVNVDARLNDVLSEYYKSGRFLRHLASKVVSEANLHHCGSNRVFVKLCK